MSAYLILLALFAISWAIAGFCVSTLCLKLRWNLVGGVLLIVGGFILPMIIGSAALNQHDDRSGVRLSDALTIFGMLEFSFTILLLVSTIGAIAGVLVGTVSGLWPRIDDDGNRQRSARSWTTWKLVIAGPLALTITWTLFFLADLRAKGRLADIRDKHQAILDVQEEVAPRQQNDAAAVHDALLLAILEDESPDWILENYRQGKKQPLSANIIFRRNDYDLLKIFLPGFPHTQSVLDYAQRHEDAFLELRRQVLREGLEYRHWDEEVARFTALHALARLHQDDLDSTIDDLKLLHAIANQSLDRRVEDSFSMVPIEAYRYLVFQAILGTTNPVPPEAYNVMLNDTGEVEPSLRRRLKRSMSQEVVKSIDYLLREQTAEQLDFKETFQRATERIIYQEHIPGCTDRLEKEINQVLEPSTDPFVAIPVLAFPMLGDMDEAWLLTSNYSSHMYHAIQFRYMHNVRLEVVKTVQMLEHERIEKNRFLTQQEFLIGITSPEFTAGTSIDYVTLHSPNTGKAEGAIVAAPSHRRLDDFIGLYLGPAIFPIVDATSPSLAIRSGQLNGTWELAQVKNNPLRLIIPTPKASTSNPSTPMR
ncbi:hypothetical protein [Bremerella sp. P1]|uniref:hypothetical protein n=1 Tax=Bremerella sp. P1 TaxID=3026424 RepID=UPI002368EF1A|nr:hypothetical protein [Bremerella sp. P1]WDI44475.1 hypothetical protein PSR63_11080 [Bremerella sp. P1]